MRDRPLVGSRPNQRYKLPLVTALGALSEDPIHSCPADTHRRGNSAGRITAGVHPLRQSHFRLIQRFGTTDGLPAALRRRHVGDRVLTVRASATAVTGKGIVETTTKTRRDRHVPVPGPVWERLKDELPPPDDLNALVFPSRKGGYLTLGEYRWAFDNACKAVGIEGLVPHGLRHTTASLAISAGANVKVVQRLLGHATAAMTLDRYGHLLSDDLSGVADALGKAIENTAVPLRYPEASEVAETG
jgi:integrase